LNSFCQICGFKIAFHKRKRIREKRIIKNVKHITYNNYSASDVLSKKINERSLESIETKDIINLPVNLLKTFFTEWIQIKDLSRLDHGLCLSTKRKMLLEVLNGIKLFGLKICFWADKDEFDDDAYQHYDSILNSYLQWLSKRNIFIKYLFLTRWDVINENYYRLYQLEKLVIDLNNEIEEFNVLVFKLMLKFCKKLKKIYIDNCDIFDESVIHSIAKYFYKLDFLCIHNCENFNDKCLHSLSINVQNLTELELRDLSNVAFENFDEFCVNLKNLKSLTISDCFNFKDNCLISISKNCKNLKFLELVRLQNITDEGLVHYKKGFFKLKTLTIYECENIKNLDEKKIKNNTDYKF
jgi:hypothetical protein